MRSPESEEQVSRRLVEPAPEESVLRALAQSAHPVEFIASNDEPDSDPADS